ncbi:hypothetical protein E4U41_007406 [Claviceps citrina]|nr:hypothetical protein E4U41_007406 [Claviceps citrina]
MVLTHTSHLPSFRIGDDSRISTSILAWACIRLDRLRQGYRFVRLMDMNGRPVHRGGLFVRIEKRLDGKDGSSGEA